MVSTVHKAILSKTTSLFKQLTNIWIEDLKKINAFEELTQVTTTLFDFNAAKKVREALLK